MPLSARDIASARDGAWRAAPMECGAVTGNPQKRIALAKFRPSEFVGVMQSTLGANHLPGRVFTSCHATGHLKH